MYSIILKVANSIFVADKTVGYEEPVYSLNENSSTMICINVTNPPLEEPLITTSVLLTGPSILITAGEHVMCEACYRWL